jgi:hypothetical protein
VCGCLCLFADNRFCYFCLIVVCFDCAACSLSVSGLLLIACACFVLIYVNWCCTVVLLSASDCVRSYLFLVVWLFC